MADFFCLLLTQWGVAVTALSFHQAFNYCLIQKQEWRMETNLIQEQNQCVNLYTNSSALSWKALC